MKIKDIALSAAYVGQRVVKAICVGAQEVWSAVKYLVFKDPVVAQICATNWGDGVGITEEQAAAVTDIGTIFQGNTDITSFDELNKFGVTELKNNAFKGCSSLERINISSIKVIREASFRECVNLKDIGSDLSEVEYIYGYNSFYKTTKMSIPISLNKVKYIGAEAAFRESGITEVRSTGSVTEIPFMCFMDCKNLQRVVLSQSVNTIARSAFNGCSSLTDINLSYNENIIQVKSNAFVGCTNLIIEDLSLPNVEIFEGQFNIQIKKVSNLGKISSISGEGALGKVVEEVVFPNTLTSISDMLFYNCKNLRTLVMNSVTPPTLGGSRVFNSTPIASGTGSIYVPDQSVQAYREASGWLSYADRIKPLSQYVES